MKQLHFMEWLMLGLLALSIVGFGYQGKATNTSGHRQLVHQVVITFQPETPEAILKQVDASFAKLGKMKMVQAFESHVIENDDRNPGNRRLYITTFKDKAGLTAYGESKEHQAHIKVGEAYVARVDAFDYYTH